MLEYIAAAVGTVVNGAWGWRLESKTAVLEERVEGQKELQDERHDVVVKRLDIIDSKLDRLLSKR